MKNIIASLLVFFSGISQANDLVSWDKKGALPIEKVQQRLALVDTKQIKDFAEVFIDIDIDKTINQSVQRVRRAYYFPDANAVQNYGSDSIGFNTGLDHLKIFRIVSITPDGVVREFNSTDLKVNDTNSYNTFSSAKTAVFSYPGLEAGGFTVLEFEITRNIKQQETDWFKEFYPQNLYARRDFQLSVSWDDSSPLRFSNDSPYIKCQQQEKKVHCFGKDIPKAESDTNLLWADQLGSVKFGELNSWDEVVSRALDKFSASQNVDQKIIADFVDNMVADESDIDKKISAIHEFVSQKIQYLSHSEHGNSYTPHSVVRTLQQRMGDCKDKTALFYSMLKVIGVEAYPVLVATDRRKISRTGLPSMAHFDHMIICFKLSSGKQACSDPTNYFSDWRYISPHIQDRIALPLIKNSELINLPANEYRWFLQAETTLTFLEDGGQNESQTRHYLNEYANHWRDFLLQKDDKDRNQWLIDSYKEKVAEKADVKFSVDGLQDVELAVVIKSESSHPPLIDTNDSLDYAESDAWLADELEDARIPNKRYEYNVPGFHVISKTIWDVSRLWAIKTLPAETELKNEFGSMVRRVKAFDKGRVQIITEVKVPRRLVPPNDIERFNKFISLLKRESTIHLYGNLKEE